MNTTNNAMNSHFLRMVKSCFEYLNRYKLHFIIWSVYIIYESVLVGFFTGEFGKFENYFIHYSLNISLFYLNVYMMQVINHKARKLFYLNIFLLIGVEICFYVLLLATLNHFFTEFNQSTSVSWLGIDRRYIFGATYRGLYFILFSCGYWVLIRFIKQRQISADLETKYLQNKFEKETVTKELVLAQNAYLKAQINPHFLFNTLSFVHRRVRKTDEDAGNLIVALANLMRYALDINHSEEYILLTEEIEQVENLINLFKIKEKLELYISFNYEEVASEQKLIPLALMTLAENIFKHGILTEIESPAKISLNYQDGVILIETENKTDRVPKSLSLKTGLDNLKKRLKNAYGKKAELTWGLEGDLFKARLKVDTRTVNFAVI